MDVKGWNTAREKFSEERAERRMKCKGWFFGFSTGRITGCMWALPTVFLRAVMSWRAVLGCVCVSAVYGGKGMKQSWRTWGNRQGQGGICSRWRIRVGWYLHIIDNDYWYALHTLGYSFTSQSGSTLKVTARKRREIKSYRSTWEYGLMEWGEGRGSWWSYGVKDC